MNQDNDLNNSENRPQLQQQRVGDIQVPGDENTINIVQGGSVTFTQTKIIQISVDEIKARKPNTTSPYKGLSAFGREDSDRFFGRDQFLASMIDELEQTNFVLLLGASGSGKSSVVRAGLIPWLQQKWGNHFCCLILTPDHDPFDSLYGSLLAVGYRQAEAQIARAAANNTLTQVVKRLKPEESFWLVFIDQFEELFTTSETEKRDRFITNLVELSQALADDPSLKIVATMRSDFLDQLDAAPANQLAGLTQKHRPLITQMHSDELRLAIEQPAAHHGVVFEKGLVEDITKDVYGQAGYLPLLQYTLDLLWQTDKENDGLKAQTLHTLSYRRLGGVRGALQKQVDRIYGEFLPEQQLAAKRIFLKLVQVGNDEAAGADWKPFRRRADLSEFTNEQEITVLHILINRRLLVSNETKPLEDSPAEEQRRHTVEIAHEVLLTSWSQLHDWIRHHREEIALRNRLNDDVRQWKITPSDDELWSGRKLNRVVQLRNDPDFVEILGGFSADAQHFIDASVGLANRRRHKRIQQELKVKITAGDDRRAALLGLLESCTVRLTILGEAGSGTGFFVAPGMIVTCAPDIVGAGTQSINIRSHAQQDLGTAAISGLFESDSLAILTLHSPPPDHPCVWLDKTFRADDPICTYGFSKGLIQGVYNRGKGHKQTRQHRHTIEFETYKDTRDPEDFLELQSSALLNWKTGKVCGIVHSTHDHVRTLPDQPEGMTVGRATSAAVILKAVEELKRKQKAFHKKDHRWRELLPRVRSKPRTVLLACLGITALITLARDFQVFQPLEFAFYDQLISLRRHSLEQDDRFLIIRVTQQDVEKQVERGEDRDDSLSATTLIRVLEKINTELSPVAIGLDIYRDIDSSRAIAFEEQKDWKALEEQKHLETLYQNPDLMAICRYPDENEGERDFSAPPGVALERVGFSNLTLDGGNIVRRHLLAGHNDRGSKCTASKSFSLLLAEHYLEKVKNIQTTFDVAASCRMEFSNNVVLNPNFQPNTGGYQGYLDDSRFNGCQMLLNYQKEYITVSVEEFIDNDFPSNEYGNRIVLIGIDRSENDTHGTPYDHENNTLGVSIHAQVVSHMLDAATQQDGLIWVLPFEIDVLLILGFALVGGGLGWWLLSLRELGVVIVVMGIGLLVISVVAFYFNAWISLVPYLLALSGTSICVGYLNLRIKLNAAKQ